MADPTDSLDQVSPARDFDGTITSPSRETEAVTNACKAGGCQKEITGQCCQYQSELNAAMQKAMAPYSDSCGSCGGSGISGGGSGGSSSGGSSGSSSTLEADLYTFKFEYETETDHFPKYVIRDTDVHGTWSNIIGYSDVYHDDIPIYDGSDPPEIVSVIQYKEISSTGLLRFNNTDISLSTILYVANEDIQGNLISDIFDLLNPGDLINFTKFYDTSVFILVRYISQSIHEDTDTREIAIEYMSSSGDLSDEDILVMGTSRNIIKIPRGANTVDICPDCMGTGLEGCVGGIEGLLMSVYNGCAEFAGVTDVDIYGIRQ